MKSGQFEQHTVSAAFVIGILKALKLFDEVLFDQISDYLGKSETTLEYLETPTKRIPYGQLIELLDEIYSMSGSRREISIEIGSRLTPSSFSALGYAATSCKTLGLAMETIPIYEKVAVTMGVTRLIKSNGLFELTWSSEADRYSYLLEEIILSAWVQLARTITNQPVQAQKVMLTGPKPEHIQLFKQLFGDSLAFGQNTAGVLFSDEIMNLEVIHFDPFINELMTQQAQALQNALPSKNTLQHSVSQAILQGLIHGKLSQEYIASIHSMSTRTLRRSLNKEGTSYQKILEGVRRKKSRDYLQDSNLSIFEVAMLLGYKEHSTFTAAFKLWYGFSPIEFRETNNSEHV